MVWKLPSAAAVTAPVKGALALIPAFPWYAWAGLGVGAAILLGGGVAAAAVAAPAGSGPLPKPGGTAPVLKLGSTGEWVSYLQDRLAMTVTGTFDDATDAAVKGFQSANGLQADGIVGPASWGKLGVSGAAPGGGGGGGGGGAPPPQPGPIVPAPQGPPTAENPFGLAQTIDAREGQILAHIQSGNVEHQWWPLDYTADGHQIHIEVSRRALALNDGTNKLIVDGSMRTAQKAADMIGGAIPTTRILDEVYKQAKQSGKIVANSGGAPPSQKWQGAGGDDSGSKTGRMYDQSAYLEKLVGGFDSGFVVNEGKDWVQTRHYWDPPQGLGPTSSKGSIHNHANFGWYYPPSTSHSPGGVPVIQSIGETHAPGFTDYSQLWRFVRANSLTIDGVAWDWGAALADPTVSKYIQDEGGTIPSPRHPDL